MNPEMESISKERLTLVKLDLASATLSYFIIFSLVSFRSVGDSDGNLFVTVVRLGIFVAISGFIYWLSGYYNHPYQKSRLSTTGMSVISGLTVITLFSLLPIPFLYTWQAVVTDGGLKEIGLFSASLIVPCLMFRLIMISLRNKNRNPEDNKIRCVGVGDEKEIAAYRESLILAGLFRETYDIVRSISFAEAESLITTESGGSMIMNFLTKEDASCLILFGSHSGGKNLESLLNHCVMARIPLRIAPDGINYMTRSIRLRDIYGEPFVDLISPAMTDFSFNLKRSADFLISLTGLIALLPLMIGIAIAVKADSRGKVIYSQIRLGRNNRPFRIYKFRSMVVDAEGEMPMLSEKNDSRITTTGRILRRFHLDELPQLWNILKGDMSVVGPRPERPYFASKLLREMPGYGLVTLVKPGLTSWAMVRYGYAGNLEEMKERVRYDLLYLSNMSLMLDLKIIIYTVRVVLTGKGI